FVRKSPKESPPYSFWLVRRQPTGWQRLSRHCPRSRSLHQSYEGTGAKTERRIRSCGLSRFLRNAEFERIYSFQIRTLSLWAPFCGRRNTPYLEFEVSRIFNDGDSAAIRYFTQLPSRSVRTRWAVSN